jgi:hypothetical protein
MVTGHQQQDDDEAPDPFRDTHHVEGAIDDLNQDKGDTRIHRRYPENTTAFQFCKESG